MRKLLLLLLFRYKNCADFLRDLKTYKTNEYSEEIIIITTTTTTTTIQVYKTCADFLRDLKTYKTNE